MSNAEPPSKRKLLDPCGCFEDILAKPTQIFSAYNTFRDGNTYRLT